MEDLINVTFQVVPGTDRDKFIDSICKVYDGTAEDEDTDFVLSTVVKVYETDLK